MKTRISGKEAARVAEDMAKPGPIRVVAASEAQEAPGALVPSPGSELDRKAPPRVRKPLPRNDQWKAPTPDLEGEHVDVHAGGQAVVGMIESPRGGDQPKSEDQPRAKQIAHAPQPAVWSADKERQPLPVSGDAERPLPDARRDVPGRPEG